LFVITPQPLLIRVCERLSKQAQYGYQPAF